MNANRTSRGCAILAVTLTVLAVSAGQARSEDWFDFKDKALAAFDFEGRPLPATPDKLKQAFPQAKPDTDRMGKEVGLECYALRNLKNADLARFYFCDGELYQLEVIYTLARVEKLGGMQTVVQKLIDMWGVADHVGESRWTWQAEGEKRRIDFYARAEGGQLVVTDMGLMPTVEKRTKRVERKAKVDLGL